MDDSLYKSDLIDLQEIDTKIDNLFIDKESSDRVESLKHAEQEYKKSITKSLSETVSIEFFVGVINFSFFVV